MLMANRLTLYTACYSQADAHTEFYVSRSVRLHHRLYHECNFPPTFPQRGPLKGLLTESRALPQISQATRAWWIIQSKVTTCRHVAISAMSCLTCEASLVCIYMSGCPDVYIYVGLCCLGCYEFWSLDGSSCNATCNQISVKGPVGRSKALQLMWKKYEIMERSSNFTFLSLFQILIL